MTQAVEVPLAWSLLKHLGASPPTLGDIGALVEGIATAVLALGVVGGGGFALFRYFKERGQQAEERRRQADLDVVRLAGEMATIARRRYERARGSPEEPMLREELEQAEDEFEGIARGLPIVRPELARARQEAIGATIKELTVEKERLETGPREGRPDA